MSSKAVFKARDGKVRTGAGPAPCAGRSRDRRAANHWLPDGFRKAETAFVEGPPDDAARKRKQRQAVQVFQRANTPGRDDRSPDPCDERLDGIKVWTLQHAITGDV